VIFAFPDTATLLSSFSAHGPSGIAKLWPLRWRASPLWAIVVGAAVFAVLASPEQARAMLHWRF
jgi:hypothetical protein